MSNLNSKRHTPEDYPDQSDLWPAREERLLKDTPPPTPPRTPAPPDTPPTTPPQQQFIELGYEEGSEENDEDLQEKEAVDESTPKGKQIAKKPATKRKYRLTPFPSPSKHKKPRDSLLPDDSDGKRKKGELEKQQTTQTRAVTKTCDAKGTQTQKETSRQQGCTLKGTQKATEEAEQDVLGQTDLENSLQRLRLAKSVTFNNDDIEECVKAQDQPRNRVPQRKPKRTIRGPLESKKTDSAKRCGSSRETGCMDAHESER